MNNIFLKKQILHTQNPIHNPVKHFRWNILWK